MYTLLYIILGIVLGTLYVGGFLMSTNEMKAGDLMSFMVAVQTIQRYTLMLYLCCTHLLEILENCIHTSAIACI